jgi:hypothetical protein
MSTAIVPADHVGAEEQKKDVVVVTPDVVEVSTTVTKARPFCDRPLILHNTIGT